MHEARDAAWMSVEHRRGRPDFERLTTLEACSMNHVSAQRIAQLMSTADARELKLLDRGLRTNEPFGHDRSALAHLIKMELACPNGMAVRITDLGSRI